MTDILVIDDVRQFRFPSGNRVVHVRDNDEALTVLSEQRVWDMLYLDHDAGIDPKTSEFIDFKPLARFIASSAKHFNFGEVVIHSYNPVGSQQLMDIMSPHWKTRRATPDEVRRLIRGS